MFSLGMLNSSNKKRILKYIKTIRPKLLGWNMLETLQVATRKDAKKRANASLLCNVKESTCQPTVEECNGGTRLHTFGAYT